MWDAFVVIVQVVSFFVVACCLGNAEGVTLGNLPVLSVCGPIVAKRHRLTLEARLRFAYAAFLLEQSLVDGDSHCFFHL